MPARKKIKKSSSKKKSTVRKTAKRGKSAKSKSLKKVKSAKKKSVIKNEKSKKSAVKKIASKKSQVTKSKSAVGTEQKKNNKEQDKLQKMEHRKIYELKRELNNLEQKIKEKVQIKDAEGRLYCQEEFCDQPAVSGDFCRYHYLALWKYFQVRKQLLQEGFLFKRINDLIKSFGDVSLDFILADCKNEKAFESATKEITPAGKDEDNSGMETNY